MVVYKGVGSAVLEFMSDNNYNLKVKRLGISDNFIHHGTQEELHDECGIDVKAIIDSVHYLLKNNHMSQVG